MSEPIPASLRFARHVAVWPMTAGVAITLLAMPFPSTRLAFCGLMLFYIATPINLLGILLLIIFWFKHRQAQIPGAWRRSLRTSLVLLLLNYPVAYLCVIAGEKAVKPAIQKTMESLEND